MKYYACHMCSNSADELICTYFVIESEQSKKDFEIALMKEAQRREDEYYGSFRGSLGSYKIFQDDAILWVENNSNEFVLQVVKDPEDFERLY